MLNRFSIRSRQIAVLLILIAGFVVLGLLTRHSLRSVQSSAETANNLTRQQVALNDIEARIYELINALEVIESNPGAAPRQQPRIESLLNEVQGNIDTLDREAYGFLLAVVDSFSLLESRLHEQLIPAIEQNDTATAQQFAMQQLDQTQNLHLEVETAGQSLSSEIAIQNAKTDEQVERAMSRVLMAFFGIGVLVAILLASNTIDISAGIQQLIHGADTLARNQAGIMVQVSADRQDEFAELATSFNLMATAISNQRLSLQNHMRDLQIARARAESDTAKKTAYLATISHELRAPLHIIMNFTTMMAAGELGAITEEQKHFLNRVINSSENLLTVVNDLLDLAKLEAGQLVINAETFDLVPLLQEMETNALALIQTTGKPLHFHMRAPEDLPYIHADPVRVRQIMLNLIGNAVAYSDEGSITLSFGKGTNTLTVSVEDTGPGIPPDKQQDIFDRFQQVKPGHVGGTGLGLAIAKELVELQGGRIWVNSQMGRGSAFSFTIPVSRTQPAPDTPAAAVGD